jgi:hypothetical protein
MQKTILTAIILFAIIQFMEQQRITTNIPDEKKRQIVEQDKLIYKLKEDIQNSKY